MTTSSSSDEVPLRFVIAKSFEDAYENTKISHSAGFYEYLGEKEGKVYLYQEVKKTFGSGWKKEIIYTNKKDIGHHIRKQLSRVLKIYNGRRE